MHHRYGNHANQRGYLLLGAVLAVGILAAILMLVTRTVRNHTIQSRANRYGSALAQYAVGLRGYNAAVQGGTQSMPANPATFNGVRWLKAPACGGQTGNPPEGYIPCSFDGGMLGKTYRTTITRNPATNHIEARTDFMVPAGFVGKAGQGTLAAATAGAALAQQTLAANGTFYNIFANTPRNANANVPVNTIAKANRGRVLLVVDNDPSYDIWLRTDGTNQMLADLNMGGNSLNNAANGGFSGDVRIDGTAQIGNGLSVTNGTADIRDGVITKDVRINSIGRMASQAIYRIQVKNGATSYRISKPDCSRANAGSSTAGIYAVLQGTGTPASANADALYDAHVNVRSSGNQWIVTPVVRAIAYKLTGTQSGSNFTVKLTKDVKTANGRDQTILVMTKCK